MKNKTYTKVGFIQRIIDCGKDYEDGVMIHFTSSDEDRDLLRTISEHVLSCKVVFSFVSCYCAFVERGALAKFMEELKAKTDDCKNLQTISSFLETINRITSSIEDSSIVTMVSKEEALDLNDYCNSQSLAKCNSGIFVAVDQDEYIDYMNMKKAS